MNTAASELGFWFGPAGGATIALIGVVVTVLAGIYLSRRARKWQIQDENRRTASERGEELYTLITKWGRSQTSWFLKCRLVMQNHIDYNKFLDLHIAENEGKDLQVEKIQFMIATRFPKILRDWESCVDLAQDASRTENLFKEEYKNGIHRGDVHLSILALKVNATQVQIESTLGRLVELVQAEVSVK